MATEADATEIAGRLHGARPQHVTRFPTALANFVYDVVLEGGHRSVVRISGFPETSFEGAGAWSALLRPLGVPLPAILGRCGPPQI